jgi:hypothetical protein
LHSLVLQKVFFLKHAAMSYLFDGNMTAKLVPLRMN